MTERPEFGMTRKENFYDEYIGKFVIICPNSGNNNFAGKLIEVKEGYATLNPFQGGKFDEEGKLVRELIYENSKIYILGTSIEPTTQENIINFCKRMNRKSYLEDLRDQKEIYELEEANRKKKHLVEIVQN